MAARLTVLSNMKFQIGPEMPPSGMRQSVRSGSSCFPRRYWVATNSGSSVMFTETGHV